MAALLPIDFTVAVNGKSLRATLMQIENHIIHRVFVVRFEDGYEDGFYDYEDDCVRGVNEKQSQEYARALSDDLWLFNLLDSKTTAIKNFSWEVDGVAANAWLFTKQRKEGELYTLYLKGNYMFDIWEKAGSWIVNCKDGLHPIDRSLAEHAAALIGRKPVPPATTTVAKEIEFPLQFNYDGKQIGGFGILVDSSPYPQCFVALQTDLPTKNHDVYQFFKVDEKGRVFTWHPCSKEKEPVAKAIAGALEEKFSNTSNPFSTN